MTEPYFDLPPGPELAGRNRQLIAERIGWPEGAVELCEEIEQAHPDWSVFWLPENTIEGFERPSGFMARRRDWYGREKTLHAYSDTALRAKIMAWVPPRDSWAGRR